MHMNGFDYEYKKKYITLVYTEEIKKIMEGTINFGMN